MFLIHDYAKLDWLEIRFKPVLFSKMTALESAVKLFTRDNLLDFVPARSIRFFPSGFHLGKYIGNNLIPEITLRSHIEDLETDSDYVYATLTGSHADKYLDYLSSAKLTNISVSRVDVAYDFSGGFHSLATSIEHFAQVRGIDNHRITSTTKLGTATTQYIGSRKYSPTYVRLYQKGIQMGSEPDWNRLEFELRPKRLSKEVSHFIWNEIKQRNWESVIGINKWAVDLAKKLLICRVITTQHQLLGILILRKASLIWLGNTIKSSHL